MGLLSCLCCPIFAGVLKPALLEPEDELGMQPGAAATSDADARNSVGSQQESSPHGNDERSTASLLKAQTALSNVRHGTCNSLPSATDESMLPPLLASHESCDAPPVCAPLLLPDRSPRTGKREFGSGTASYDKVCPKSPRTA